MLQSPLAIWTVVQVVGGCCYGGLLLAEMASAIGLGCGAQRLRIGERWVGVQDWVVDWVAGFGLKFVLGSVPVARVP
jgi:hypothetical protein